MTMSSRRRASTILTYVLLVLVALLFLLPMFWMLSTSLKPETEWFTRSIRWFPQRPTLENYAQIFESAQTPIARWFFNSFAIASAVTVLTLVLDALAAYAYARMDFPGRRLLFALLLATLFLPGMMFLVPNFLTTFRLGLLNNYIGVILPPLAGVFGVFFLTQFFQTIPKELEEAAVIDGASAWQTFLFVALPLARPALATLAIITFLTSWNEFLWPLLILQRVELLTLPPALATLQSSYSSEYGLTMAGAVIAAVPVLVIYIVLQRYIVQSVATTGLKG
ncbi:carbohydrate ABC transporter permease [Candidatus Gracilibacteria bacterium]|nr:carbohydrate ABC transporter permease [Candidatus Gracilibacteria bacterium]